jgi:hypothetical protein
MIRISSVRVKKENWFPLSPMQQVTVTENGRDALALFVFSATSLDRQTYTFRREA